MYAITEITGKVGGIVARTLLAAGLPVRGVVRDSDKGRPWAEMGCEVAVASIADADGLTKAFSGVDGVFLMTPPDFDPEPGFPKTHEAIAAVKAAIAAARPGKVVFLSTVGAHVAEFNLLNNSKITEEGLRTVPVPVAFLRAAWFMENASWDVEAAKAGVVSTFLQPLDHPIPMVATADIGSTAADLLRESWRGLRIVELEGPRRYSANDVAAGFARSCWPSRADGTGAARYVGGALPLAGNEASAGPHPHDRWFQRRLDRFRGSWRRAPDRQNSGWSRP